LQSGETTLLRYLRVRREPDKVAPDLGSLSADWLTRSPNIPITLRQINDLPDSAKVRSYRALLPPGLLAQHGIDPVTWQGLDGEYHVSLTAEPGTGVMSVSAQAAAGSLDEFFFLELQDTSLNGINLNSLPLRHRP
jgi:hypothetical protein